MRSKHTYVVLIDIPEALPFEFKLVKTKPDELKDGLEKLDKHAEKSESELFKFFIKLEKHFGEEFSFIGEDVIAEKFYKRFLFLKDGFIEVMYQPPAAIIAHFIEEERARNFAKALEKTIDDSVKEEKARMVLKNMIEINKEEEGALTYQKWSRLTKIRGMVSE